MTTLAEAVEAVERAERRAHRQAESFLTDSPSWRDIKDRAAALRHAASLLRVGEWRDISTAPRDGRPVLIAVMSATLVWRVKEAWWRIEYYGAPLHRGYWQAARGAVLSADVHKIGATHWRPLPEPPPERAG